MVQQMMSDPRNDARIYVSSVFNELSDEDIQSVFESFGGIISCHM